MWPSYLQGMEIVYLTVAGNEQTSVKIYSILARLTLPAENYENYRVEPSTRLFYGWQERENKECMLRIEIVDKRGERH